MRKLVILNSSNYYSIFLSYANFLTHFLLTLHPIVVFFF